MTVEELTKIATDVAKEYKVDSFSDILNLKSKLSLDVFLKSVREKAWIVKIEKNVVSISERISNGHAWSDHIDHFNSIGITTKTGLSKKIENVINSNIGTSNMKHGDNDRIAFWDYDTGLIIIFQEKHIDYGTAFIPDDGKYFFNTIFK